MFGLLRSPRAGRPERASDALVMLGMFAEERGTDSAGIALVTGRPVGGADLPDGHTGDRNSDLRYAGTHVVKGRGAFSAIWRPDLLAGLDASPLVIGHTRWATQGSPFHLANASPLIVDGVVATHNGDIEAGDLRALYPLPPATGTTDSEPMFQLLARRRTPADIAAALSTVVGRAALAWTGRGRPDRVHLARAALSPLTIAVDTDQNFFWASNPRWFRELERHSSIRFARTAMLREGTYIQVGLRLGRPRLLAYRTFTPTARSWDLDDRVWTGFTQADMEQDRANLLHRVVAPPLLPTAA
ncbi:hypothetical protein GCM10010191_58570 [Actinomadura vinacea]|uniref:Glutamine amidotransferase type-2 domain-containing protein n=1 Tax=Actinomadura vinacea TaxID=115336 RepID=A0ABN3JS12_9ACTN